MAIVKNSKKNSLYKKSLIIFTLVLLVFSVYALVYVSRVLKNYDIGDTKSFMDNFVEELTEDAKKGKISKEIKLNKITSSYEKKSDLNEGYKTLFENSKISYKKTDDNLVYDIYADDKKIMTIKLKDMGEKHALGLLVYNEYEIDNIKTYDDDGLYTVNIEVADNYDLYINDIKVDKSKIKEESIIPEYEEVYNLVDLPKFNHYEITGLTFKPKVEVKDSKGNKVDITQDGNNLYAANFKKYDTLEAAGSNIKDNFNPTDFATNWSKFLTWDLGDDHHYGFDYLLDNLIEGTALYNKGYSWATQIDIQFTSVHTLNSMSNQKVSNITIYNDDAFSAEVEVDKNMTIEPNGSNPAFDKTDKFHEMMYFVYYDGSYRVINMTTVVE